jgi:18S rRNA (adenine1779-N6/adenine1780-N6)-dimethyltransferase
MVTSSTKNMTVAPIWGAAAAKAKKKVAKKAAKSSASTDTDSSSSSKNIAQPPITTTISRSLTTAAAGPATMNKDLGQHLLKNPQLAATITAAAGIAAGDTVVEIGPGTGNLTVHILASPAARVIAMEMDPRMVRELERRFAPEIATGRLQVVEGDFLKEFDQVVKNEQEAGRHGIDLVISNTPYQISSPLVYKLLEQLAVGPAGALVRPTRTLVLMFQQEFVDRLLAAPGTPHYGKLPVLVNQYSPGGIEYVCKVGKNNFRPPPKVESAVVKINLLLPEASRATETDDQQVEPAASAVTTDRRLVSFAEFDGLVRHVFTRKNKTFASCFGSKSVLRELEAIYERRHPVATDADVDTSTFVKTAVEAALTNFADVRPSKCGHEVFWDLLLSFHAHGIYFSS